MLPEYETLSLPGDLLAVTALPTGNLHAKAWTAPLDQIAKLDPKVPATQRLRKPAELTGQGSEIIIPVLEAMESAGPLARNWMRSAVETVFEKDLAASADLPTNALKIFLLDRNNEPNARRLAFDLYHRVTPNEADAIVPQFIDDPSPGLRREAVARLIDEGQNLLNQERKEESITTLTSALEAAREVNQIDEIAKLLREKLDQKVDLPRQFGFLMYWDLIAPFDNSDRGGFDLAYPPEESIDLNGSYPDKEGKEISWQAYSTSDDYGMVDFNKRSHPSSRSWATPTRNSIPKKPGVPNCASAARMPGRSGSTANSFSAVTNITVVFASISTSSPFISTKEKTPCW